MYISTYIAIKNVKLNCGGRAQSREVTIAFVSPLVTDNKKLIYVALEYNRTMCKKRMSR